MKRTINELRDTFIATLKSYGHGGAYELLREEDFQRDLRGAVNEQAEAKISRIWSEAVKEVANRPTPLASVNSVFLLAHSMLTRLSADIELDRLVYFMQGEARQRRLLELEARLSKLERSQLHYEGVHQSGKAYKKGSLVTYSGSVWHANSDTSTVPGDGQAWTLAVKRGRDA